MSFLSQLVLNCTVAAEICRKDLGNTDRQVLKFSSVSITCKAYRASHMPHTVHAASERIQLHSGSHREMVTF